MCITFRPCSEPDLPGIYWRDDDQWRPYDRATSRAILKAASLGLRNVSLGIFTSNVYPSGATYTLDLQSLQQRNTRSGQERPVLIIPKLTLTELSTAVVTPSVGLTYMDTAEAGNLDLAFHGTSSSCFDPILRNGMSPTHRKSTPLGDWFTRQVSYAAHYSQSRDGTRGYGGRKLIAFLLLVEKKAVVQESGDVIVMSDTSHQLPVAEVTVQ
ncbi:unnamed protein product [Closterium sp. NIES-64]|nr:unnamed protein product [Closterium sp. NIES-64]